MTGGPRTRVDRLDGTTTRTFPAAKHPATFSGPVLDSIMDFLAFEYGTRTKQTEPIELLDPFAGIGKIHDLADRPSSFALDTVGVELEPEWAARRAGTFVGDATALPADWSGRFDVVATSPCYGNRMADSHTANDACSACGGTGTRRIDGMTCVKCSGSGLSPRRSYTHDLGRKLTPGNSGSMQWGIWYRDLHERAWAEVHRVLRPGGLFLLNIGDHVRNGKRVRVSTWHLKTAKSLGFVHEWTYLIPLPGMRYGENNGARIGHEFLYVLRKA